MLATGEAQFVDVSAQTAMVWSMLYARVAHAVQGFDFNRGGSVLQLGPFNMPIVYECADGYIVVAPLGSTLVKLVPWMAAEGTVPQEWVNGEDWPLFERKMLYHEPLAYSLEEVVAAMRVYLKTRSKNDLLELGLREGVTLAPVSTTEDLTRFRQLEERGYWLDAPLPNGATAKAPGVIAQLTGTPMNVRRWAPTLGQHNVEILCDELGMEPSALPELARSGVI